MRNFIIQIPQPCPQNWADMQPTEQGRFCVSCQKTVVDYTDLPDKELIKRFGQESETTCGRFRNEQLNRPLLSANPDNTPVWRHWVGLLTMTLFGWQTARAQLNPTDSPLQSTRVKQASVRPEFSATTIPARAVLNPTTWTVTGRVMRMDSTGKRSPVPEATVDIRQFTEAWHTKTDSTGAFELLVSTQRQITELTAWVSTPGHLHGHITIGVSPATTSIVVDDIVLNEPRPSKNISSGGMVLIHTPSRWQKFKRNLTH